MQRKHCVSCLAVLAMVCLAATARAQEPITLSYKVSEGDQLIYRTVSAVDQTQTFGDNKFEMKMKTTEVAVRTYEKLGEKGELRFQSENKRLLVGLESDQLGKYTYDSKVADRDSGSVLSAALNPVYDRLNGAVLQVSHDALGKVSKVEGFKELLGDVVQDNPLAAQFAGGGSDEVAKVGFQDQLLVLSDKAVKPGDTWESAVEMKLPKIGDINGKRTFRFEGMEKRGETEVAKISVTTDFSVDVNIDAGGAKVTGKIATDKSSGTIQFDPAKGRLVSMNTSYSFSGDLGVEAGDQMLTINTSQTQTTAIELLDKLPE